MQNNQPKIDLDQTTAITCECGNEYFTEVIALRKVSKLLIGAQEDQLVNVPALKCTKCDAILDMEKL